MATDTTSYEAVFPYFPEVWKNQAQLTNIVPIFPTFMDDVSAGSSSLSTRSRLKELT